MATATIVVSFTYDLPSKDNFHDQFKKILEGLGWSYTVESFELPNSTCISISKLKSENEALEAAIGQVKEVVRRIRDAGFADFNISKYFFLAHKVPSSAGAIGTNLL